MIHVKETVVGKEDAYIEQQCLRTWNRPLAAHFLMERNKLCLLAWPNRNVHTIHANDKLSFISGRKPIHSHTKETLPRYHVNLDLLPTFRMTTLWPS